MNLKSEIQLPPTNGALKPPIGRILIIDDEVELLNILVEVLKQQNYDVTGFTSGSEGLARLRHESYDILLSDLMMPEMDGLEVLRLALQTDPNLVCVLMTGQGTIQSAVDAMKVGAFDYVLKPFRLSGITPVLRRAMNSRRLRLEKVRRDLEEQRMRVQNIVANVPGVVWETWGDPNAAVKGMDFVSDYVEEMVGYSIEEWLATPSFWLSIVHPDDRERAAAEAAATFLNGGRNRIEFRWIAKDGRTLWVESHYTAIADEYERPVGMRGVTIDITARKQTEEQLRQAQKMEAIGQLAGGVAHDFNNLLTAINGYSELALRRIAPEDPLTKNLEEIKRAGNRAASLTRQLLAFSRKQGIEPRVLDLNSIIAEVEKMLRRLIGENIDLVTELSNQTVAVKADPGQIEQVLMNLVVNSRDAMPHGGKLVISTTCMNHDEESARRHPGINPGPHVMLTVTDTGVGMDPETQARIFEPFFTTKGQDRGTGLGLTMVYGIVRQSGGAISVESREQQGTTFRIYIPQVTLEGAENCSDKKEQENCEGTETVLVVEDEHIVRKLASQILQLHGYSVLEAANGGAALKICEQHKGPIQLLLSDVVMPEMGGVELSDRLNSLRPGMKQLFMSGYTDNVVVTNFIQKPFAHDELTRKVREVLDS